MRQRRRREGDATSALRMRCDTMRQQTGGSGVEAVVSSPAAEPSLEESDERAVGGYFGGGRREEGGDAYLMSRQVETTTGASLADQPITSPSPQ